MVGVKSDDAVLSRRCAGCHNDSPQAKDVKHLPDFKKFAGLLYNLTEPEKSPILLAPLSKQAGGWGICKEETGTTQSAELKQTPQEKRTACVFEAKDDPDYQTILTSIQEAKQNLDKIKRFDMPDFRPNEHYIREMKRYGILPKDLGPTDKIDPYAVDQMYWQSFWYKQFPDEHQVNGVLSPVGP